MRPPSGVLAPVSLARRAWQALPSGKGAFVALQRVLAVVEVLRAHDVQALAWVRQVLVDDNDASHALLVSAVRLPSGDLVGPRGRTTEATVVRTALVRQGLGSASWSFGNWDPEAIVVDLEAVDVPVRATARQTARDLLARWRADQLEDALPAGALERAAARL